MNPYSSSPRKTPIREDSHCQLLENSCDDLSDEDEEEEIELLVEEDNVVIQRKTVSKNPMPGVPMSRSREPEDKVQVWRESQATTTTNNDESTFCPSCGEDDTIMADELLSHRRDSDVPLGAGCLPCTPKLAKKVMIKKKICSKKQPNSNKWCCGAVVSSVKKTAKKL